MPEVAQPRDVQSASVMLDLIVSHPWQRSLGGRNRERIA